MDAAKQMPARREHSRTQPRPLTLFLLLSQPCRLARIWLSMAWTQSSRSSDVEASKSHVWPVRDTIMNSNGSSGSGKERCAMTWVKERRGLPAWQGASTQTDPCGHRCARAGAGWLAAVVPRGLRLGCAGTECGQGGTRALHQPVPPAACTAPAVPAPLVWACPSFCTQTASCPHHPRPGNPGGCSTKLLEAACTMLSMPCMSHPRRKLLTS